MKTKLVNHQKKDDAVSPVIGVMLMIVVTVVIAAVVALFATNVVTSTTVAPVSIIEINASAGEPAEINDKIVMSTRGGDPIDLTLVKVVVTIDNGQNGNVYSGLERDTNVGQFLEIGKRLVVQGGDNGTSFITEEIGDGLGKLKAGDKLHISVIFNENAVIYEKDIYVKEGQSQKVITLDTHNIKDGKWYEMFVDEKEEEITEKELKSNTITFGDDYFIGADLGEFVYEFPEYEGAVLIGIGKMDEGDTDMRMFLAYPEDGKDIDNAYLNGSSILSKEVELTDGGTVTISSIPAVPRKTVTLKSENVDWDYDKSSIEIKEGTMIKADVNDDIIWIQRKDDGYNIISGNITSAGSFKAQYSDDNESTWKDFDEKGVSVTKPLSIRVTTTA